jgi:Alpha-N-acetylglucosaminidase (NAGLU) C-terminal domain
VALLEKIEDPLSCDDYYWLLSRIRKARRLSCAPPDVDRRARDIFTLWASVIRDYACRDFYELVLCYYKPRAKLYIQELRERMRLGQRLLYNSHDLDNRYGEVEKEWVAEGFLLIEGPAEPRRVIHTIASLLHESAAKNVAPELK